MKDLNNSQFLLLVILVSFVTSIATGIATVTLLDDSPEPVIQTISRIVERTVEKVEEVVPDRAGAPEKQIVTKETTIVVKEEDLITEAIDKNSKNLVRIYADNNATSSADIFLGLGTIVTKNGLIVTDASLVAVSLPNTLKLYGVMFDTTNVDLSLIDSDTKKNIALLKIANIDGDLKFNPSVLANPSTLKLGQTVMSLGGISRDTVGSGIISALLTTFKVALYPSEIAFNTSSSTANNLEIDKGTKVEKNSSSLSTQLAKPLSNNLLTAKEGPKNEPIVGIRTSLLLGDMLPGTPIFNIFGEIVAIAVQSSDKSLNLITTEDIAEMIAQNTKQASQSNNQKDAIKQTAGVNTGLSP